MVAIIVAGLMVGSELAIAALVHPTLDKLPDDVHLPAASALACVMGTVMPFWYILVFLLTLAEVVIQWHQFGRLPIWIAISAEVLPFVIPGLLSIKKIRRQHDHLHRKPIAAAHYLMIAQLRTVLTHGTGNIHGGILLPTARIVM